MNSAISSLNPELDTNSEQDEAQDEQIQSEVNEYDDQIDAPVGPTPPVEKKSMLGTRMGRRGFLQLAGSLAGATALASLNIPGARGQSNSESEPVEEINIDMEDEESWPREFWELEAQLQSLQETYGLGALDKFSLSLQERDQEFFNGWSARSNELGKNAYNRSNTKASYLVNVQEDDERGLEFKQVLRRMKNELASVIPHLAIVNDYFSIDSAGVLQSANVRSKDVFFVSEFDPDNKEGLFMKYMQDAQLSFDFNVDLMKEYLNPALVADYYHEMYRGINLIFDEWTDKSVEEHLSVRGIDGDKPLIEDYEQLGEDNDLKRIKLAIYEMEEIFSPELIEFGYYEQGLDYSEYSDTQRINSVLHFMMSQLKNGDRTDVVELVRNNTSANNLIYAAQYYLYKTLSGPVRNLKYPDGHMPQAGEKFEYQAVSSNDIVSLHAKRVERARMRVGKQANQPIEPEDIDYNVLMLRELGDIFYKSN